MYISYFSPLFHLYFLDGLPSFKHPAGFSSKSYLTMSILDRIYPSDRLAPASTMGAQLKPLELHGTMVPRGLRGPTLSREVEALRAVDRKGQSDCHSSVLIR